MADFCGATIAALKPGGAVKLSTGAVIRDDVEMPTVIQPGHRYLLFLHYLAEGDFYTIEKVWLLLNGTTIAVEPDDVARAKKGASKYSGMPEAEFLASVEEQLKSQ